MLNKSQDKFYVTNSKLKYNVNIKPYTLMKNKYNKMYLKYIYSC